MLNIEPPYRLFHQWFILFTSLLFVSVILWHEGLIGQLLINDPSRISIVIGLLFIAGTAHCGIRSRKLAGELSAMHEIIRYKQTNPDAVARLHDDELIIGNRTFKDSLAKSYFSSFMKGISFDEIKLKKTENSQLTEVLSEHARGQHEMGWFVSGLLVKLGLLGTVIGFILMLRSVMSLGSIDFNDVQALLGEMTIGMAVALNTTLMGLLTSMLLGLQYLMLDRSADKLISDAVFFTESELLLKTPALKDGD